MGQTAVWANGSTYMLKQQKLRYGSSTSTDYKHVPFLI